MGIAAVSVFYFLRAVFKQAMLYLALVWFGYALIDVLLKYHRIRCQFAVAEFNVCAFIVIGYRVTTKTWGTKTILAGLVGGLNFANIALYVKAHILLKDTPAIVFAGMNILGGAIWCIKWLNHL